MWVLKLTAGKIKTIRDRLEIDLAEALDPMKDVIDRISNDPVLLVNTIWEFCLDTCQEKEISAESFGDAITGDVIDEATDALINAIIDFFPKSKTEVLRQSLAIHSRMKDRAKKKMMGSLGAVTDEDIEKALELLAKDAGKQFTSAPESSA